MRLLSRMLLRVFVPVFLSGLAFFVLLIQMVDLFSNLVRYLNLGIPGIEIIRVQLLFMPKSINYSLPIALLFAVAFTLGNAHAHNELISVLNSGVSLASLVRPLLVIGVVLSVGTFFFEEYVVIDTFARKNEQSRQLLNIQRSFNNPDVTVRSADGRFIYSANFYDDANKQLNRLLLLRRDDNGRFVERYDADFARWDGSVWTLHNGVKYGFNPSRTDITRELFDSLTSDDWSLPPRRFQRTTQNVEELDYREARLWIRELQAAGFPFRQELIDYYSRFSFGLTPLIVVLLSSAVAGWFKKNVLLMSLLVSLVTAVLYYVTDMVAGILASDGIIPPLAGAWMATVLFATIGMMMFTLAKK